ncbi:OmpA family protein [Georgenia satyanarayanai]|uniref:OmpA family protein n=1 Tax=Georgenia satyanarayanai TaxID=860221 RepID=UPI0012658C7B|nr:OmpA family protein [Georgenia satyanarayanai]
MTRPLPRVTPHVLAAALGLALAAGTVTAAAETVHEPPPEPEGGVTTAMLHDSVIAFSTADSVRVFDPAAHVESLGDARNVDDGVTTISLSSDLLFPENSWELPSSGPGRIAGLVADVPDGATVQVTGHTDSQQPTGHDFDNQELSENRAEAVADALRSERPDLEFDVSGVGDSDPAVDEDPEDPSTYAANRRVEIAYTG